MLFLMYMIDVLHKIGMKDEDELEELLREKNLNGYG